MLAIDALNGTMGLERVLSASGVNFTNNSASIGALLFVRAGSAMLDSTAIANRTKLNGCLGGFSNCTLLGNLATNYGPLVRHIRLSCAACRCARSASGS